MASRRVRRFARTERAAHWLLAVTFFVMLFTGLCLSVSAFAGILDRPTAKAWHLWSAIALAAGLVLLALLGDRRSLARSAREIDRFDADDGRWLQGAPRRFSTAGRAAARPLQRRPEAQRLADRRPDARHVRHGACSGTASATRPTASPAP